MKYITIILTILLINGCITKTVYLTEGVVKPIYRPNYQRIPQNDNYKIVDFFFVKWAEASNQITTDEFSKLDTLEQNAYLIYEKLFSDTTFIGFKSIKKLPRYILLPNTIDIGVADSFYIKYGDVYYDNIEGRRIQNFRPRISIKNIKTLYYTDEYKEQLPIIADKLGVGGFIQIDATLMSGYPTYLETTPLITKIIYINSLKNEVCITYQDKSETYETLLRKVNDKWTKIKDLAVLSRD